MLHLLLLYKPSICWITSLGRLDYSASPLYHVTADSYWAYFKNWTVWHCLQCTCLLGLIFAIVCLWFTRNIWC